VTPSRGGGDTRTKLIFFAAEFTENTEGQTTLEGGDGGNGDDDDTIAEGHHFSEDGD